MTGSLDNCLLRLSSSPTRGLSSSITLIQHSLPHGIQWHFWSIFSLQWRSFAPLGGHFGAILGLCWWHLEDKCNFWKHSFRVHERSLFDIQEGPEVHFFDVISLVVYFIGTFVQLLTILSTLGVQMSTEEKPKWSTRSPKAPFWAPKMTQKTPRRDSKAFIQAEVTERVSKRPNLMTKLDKIKPNLVLILVNVTNTMSILYNLKLWCD